MASPLPKLMPGEVFGRLTVVSEPYRKGNNLYVKVSCSCGISKEVSQTNLRSGRTNSCGCLNKQLTAERSKTHGMRHKPVYNVWASMVQRCTNANNLQYPDYGGRGITVAPEWLTFEGFYADMGEPESSALTLERVDNDKGYNKSNCYWATRTEQNNNRRNTVRYTFEGKSLTLAEWAEATGLSLACLRSRIYLYEWPIEKALTEPLQKDRL